MKYYAVIDTNVLVSAMLKWNSIPGHVMELVFEGPIVPLLDERIVGVSRGARTSQIPSYGGYH